MGVVSLTVDGRGPFDLIGFILYLPACLSSSMATTLRRRTRLHMVVVTLQFLIVSGNTEVAIFCSHLCTGLAISC